MFFHIWVYLIIYYEWIISPCYICVKLCANITQERYSLLHSISKIIEIQYNVLDHVHSNYGNKHGCTRGGVLRNHLLFMT